LKKKFAIIVNPIAGRGRTLKKLKVLKSLTDNAKYADFDFYFTEYPQHATQIAEAIHKNYDAVLAFGGDGTANEVMNGLIGTDTPFGIIPQGTGNDFARSMKMSFDIKETIEKILKFNTRKIDIGSIGDKFFLNGVGIGFDGYVSHVAKKIKILKGPIIYFTTILYCMLVWKAIPIHLEIDGKHYGKMHVFLLAVGNGNYIGGGLKLTPNAVVDDENFDICKIDNLPIFKVIFNLFRLKDGTIERIKEVSILRGKSLLIRSHLNLPIHYDGELFQSQGKDVKITIYPKSALVISG